MTASYLPRGGIAHETQMLLPITLIKMLPIVYRAQLNYKFVLGL
jgi:hypothetical protein